VRPVNGIGHRQRIGPMTNQPAVMESLTVEIRALGRLELPEQPGGQSFAAPRLRNELPAACIVGPVGDQLVAGESEIIDRVFKRYARRME